MMDAGGTSVEMNSVRRQFIAERGTILRTQVGSGVHGVAVSGQDDRDEMGICVEPADCVIGLYQFEQYEYRTQPQGVRSGPGDLDLTIYSLRKWMRLALKGNPSILIPLFVPEHDVVTENQHGRYLREHPELVVSREAGARFLGYMTAQRERLVGERGRGSMPKRPELIEQYGFDTKYAYHMIRLGMQGYELMTTGRITLPMPEPTRTWLTDLRVGRHTLQEAMARVDDVERQLKLAIDTSDLPEHPDYSKANAFLIDTYQEMWKSWPNQSRGRSTSRSRRTTTSDAV